MGAFYNRYFSLESIGNKALRSIVCEIVYIQNSHGKPRRFAAMQNKKSKPHFAIKEGLVCIILISKVIST